MGGGHWSNSGLGRQTDNGGFTWPFYLYLYMNDPVESFCFTDENYGWVCGGEEIQHTTDGGLGMESWESQNIDLMPSQQLYLVFFIDSLNGWAYGRGGYINFISKLYKTTDGGNNWELQNNNMNYVNDMCFLNDSIGYGAGGVFSYTTDGGLTQWTSVDINMAAMSLGVIDENNIWIAGYDDNEKGIIKSSNDGGLTWNIKLEDIIQPLNDITFIDSINGWAVGESGTILQTSDGGDNWEFQESGTIADLNSVYFVDQYYGWICGDSSIILHTNNGGTVGVREIKTIQNTINVFPNPSTGIINIQFEFEKENEIILTIQNISGKEMKNIPLGVKKTGNFEMNCADLPQGIYFITLKTDKATLTEKIIIE